LAHTLFNFHYLMLTCELRGRRWSQDIGR